MNQFSKDYLVVAQNASGRNMNVPLYRFKGRESGPKVYIQSSIHGAEVQGNVVIYHLIQLLKHTAIRGEIILVPNCNPVGTNIKAGEYTLGRFDPVNGTNWNRGYYYDESLVQAFAQGVKEGDSLDEVKSRFRDEVKQRLDEKLSQTWGLGLAHRLNLKLQQLAFDADYVIDIHNGPVSTRHIYVPEYAKASATLFNIPHVIFIPNQFAGALDEATFCPWWTLQNLLSEKFQRDIQFNVEAFTLEMGSQEVISFEDGKFDAVSVMSYLNNKGALIDADYQPADMRRVSVKLANYKILYTQQGGIVEYLVAPGEEVKKGQPLARVLNVDELENARATYEIAAPCDLITILHFPSASVLSGTQLYKCFTEYERLT
ncbi:succinylglutamate desuccinylase/aspartoacylase family protein [Aestuariibacter sp. AA17]|uniref:Succinylglutamate desuccinylase/aspartoacylase family protein n=1 Tax=Fluctibacter corallii TaxID=2984329 RepID=A0ABT3A3Y2_9ALTE|nr:succinylglutamate desuccinylase/aspartoacylase family protein [Aestuariibacter sp. AA17]MCV2883358.1 succinylglutamate desuccinylase/aspartoacylase family protein [Aestuariibacter sp. AA17]